MTKGRDDSGHNFSENQEMGCLQKLLQMMCDPQGAGFHGGEVCHFITMVILPSEMVILPSKW